MLLRRIGRGKIKVVAKSCSCAGEEKCKRESRIRKIVLLGGRGIEEEW